MMKIVAWSKELEPRRSRSPAPPEAPSLTEKREKCTVKVKIEKLERSALTWSMLFFGFLDYKNHLQSP
jgi:hypothetical protein